MATNKDRRHYEGKLPRGAKVPGQKLDIKVLKRVLSYLLRFKVRLIIAFIGVIGGAVGGVFSALSLGWLIDDCITPMIGTGFQAGILIKFILRMAAIFLSTIACSYVSGRIFAVLCQDIMREIRDDLFDHMQTLPIKYFDTHTHGKIMSHYTNDTETLRQLLAQTIPQIVSASITLIVSFVSMAMTSIWLLLYVLVFVALLSLLTGKIGGISGRFFVRQQDRIASLNGFIEEMISGQRVVKVFNHEKKAIEDFTEENNNLFEVASKANSIAGTMGPIMNNLGNLMYVILAVIGAIMITFHAPNLTFTGITVLTVGNIVSFLQLSKNFSQTVANVAQQMNSIVMAMAGAKRIFDLMDMEGEVNEGKVVLVNAKENQDGSLVEVDHHTKTWAWKIPSEDGFTLKKLAGDVRLSHINFGYNEEKEVLHDITLYAEPGQKVAFVGSTGAGKTTITNLINRFYDVQAGEIVYDGIPVTQIEKSALRKSLGIVLQDVNLFTGTIRENIRYGNLKASDEEVEAAARLANAHDFISRLPEGYDTMIDGTGSQLSQGQRQLISIARAAIADPPVMILDEATSSIDTRTEAIVQRGMDALMKGRTVFVIAHRLSTVQNSDVIMVLEHGKIIERGSHEELIEEKGKYYQLYTGAFELE